MVDDVASFRQNKIHTSDRVSFLNSWQCCTCYTLLIMAATSSISNCMVIHSMLVLRQWRKPPRISAVYMVIQSMLALNLLAGVSRNSQL